MLTFKWQLFTPRWTPYKLWAIFGNRPVKTTNTYPGPIYSIKRHATHMSYPSPHAGIYLVSFSAKQQHSYLLPCLLCPRYLHPPTSEPHRSGPDWKLGQPRDRTVFTLKFYDAPNGFAARHTPTRGRKTHVNTSPAEFISWNIKRQLLIQWRVYPASYSVLGIQYHDYWWIGDYNDPGHQHPGGINTIQPWHSTLIINCIEWFDN